MIRLVLCLILSLTVSSAHAAVIGSAVHIGVAVQAEAHRGSTRTLMDWNQTLDAAAQIVGSATTPTNEDYGLATYANADRASINQLPLIWNPNLFASAEAKSSEQAAHGGTCDMHNSCDGTVWFKRVTIYYPNWTALGENAATATSDARAMVDAWIASPGHKANIENASFVEMGASLTLGQTAFGKLGFGIQDFGSRGVVSLNSYPTLPVGTVNSDGQLAVNYFSPTFEPLRVQAVVGTQCVPLSLWKGSKKNGTWVAPHTLTGGCESVHFETKRADGVVARFPAAGAIAVGCTAVSDTSPPCSLVAGGIPEPSQTPTAAPAATPTAVAQAKIENLKVTPNKKQTIVTGFVTLKAPYVLINDVTLQVGTQTILIARSCIEAEGQGAKSTCGPDFKISAAKLPRFSFRFMILGELPKGDTSLTLANQAFTD